LLSVFRRQTFENSVFQMREPLRQTKFVFVSLVIVFIECAADRAAVRTAPAFTLNDLIGCMMRLEAREVLFLDCWVTVKCFHDFSFVDGDWTIANANSVRKC
jgi:hypothetical protein